MNQLHEKEWAQTLLHLQKLEASILCTTALESANDQIRGHAMGLLNKSLDNQKKLFEIMNKKGWYQVEPASVDQFNRVQQSFSSMMQMQ